MSETRPDLRPVTANCQWFACEIIVRPTDRGWFDREGAPELGVALCDPHLDFVLKHSAKPVLCGFSDYGHGCTLAYNHDGDCDFGWWSRRSDSDDSSTPQGE